MICVFGRTKGNICRDGKCSNSEGLFGITCGLPLQLQNGCMPLDLGSALQPASSDIVNSIEN